MVLFGKHLFSFTSADVDFRKLCSSWGWEGLEVCLAHIVNYY